MKNTKQCPKCGSKDLIEIFNDGRPTDSGTGVMIGLTIISAIPYHRYICCSCGYSEQWFNKSNLEKLKQSKKAKPVNE